MGSGVLLIMHVCSFAEAQTDIHFGAQLTPTIQLTLEGGSNQFGKRTSIVNNSLDFGSVTFTHPELTSNGDAFLEDGLLKLEAIFDVGVVLSGTNSVALSLSRLRSSTNPFYRASYGFFYHRPLYVE